MNIEDALKYIEIAEIKINGKDTYKEHIGEFREIVKNALRKSDAKEPEEICVIDKKGAEHEVKICPRCSREIALFSRGVNYCPFCGQKIAFKKRETGKLIWVPVRVNNDGGKR